MTADELKRLNHLHAGSFASSAWQRVSFDVAEIVDKAWMYVGPITVTNAYRAEKTIDNSQHTQNGKTYALDVRPQKTSIWDLSKALRLCGARRIGFNVGRNFIHVDTGDRHGTASAPFYFMEETVGSTGKYRGSVSGNWLDSSIVAIKGGLKKYFEKYSAYDHASFVYNQLIAEMTGRTPSYNWNKYQPEDSSYSLVNMAIPAAAVFAAVKILSGGRA